MTVPGFGNVMPIHCCVLSLIGWDLNRSESAIIPDESSRIAEMRRGRQDLVAYTGRDFAYDLVAWRNYLLVNEESYRHPYSFDAVDDAVREAIDDPVYIRLAELADAVIG